MPSFSAPFIRRPVATLLMAVGLALFGMVAFARLPVSALPRVDIPTVLVSVSQPGANPETMAATVIAPLERRIGEIAGITEMTSNASTGSGNIIIQFDISRSQASVARDVQAAVNAARQDLPSGMPSPPTVRKFNPADSPVFILALTSDRLPGTALYDLADSTVGPLLSRVTGVAQVQVGGADQPAIRVAVDPAAASAAGISLEDVRSAITGANLTSAIGSIEGPDQSATLSLNDRLSRAEQFATLVVKATDTGIVRLSGIARVTEGSRNRRQAAWYNDSPSVLLQVYKQPDANVIEVVDGVRAMLPELEALLPAGTRLEVQNDRSTTIRASVHEVEKTLLISIALVIMVVALFLRRKSSVLAATISVPLSLLGTLCVMWWLGYSLNNLSLMALTISVGFVVDDAIVMIENMARLREKGLPTLEAALEGASEIGFTILSITVSLVAVFLPLLAMGGVVGRLFREFSVTLATAVVLSGLISLTVTPMVAARLASDTQRPPGRFGRAFERMMDRIQRGYLRSLTAVLRFRRIMLVATLGLVGLTVWLYVIVPKGFFPEQDIGLLRGTVQAAPDTSFAAMQALHTRAAEIIRADPAVENISGSIGSGFNASTNSGQFFISLKPRGERPPISEVIARLRGPLSTIPGASVFLSPQQELMIGGRPGNASYQYSLLGPDLEALRRWTETMVEKLRTIPGINDVSSDQERTGLVNRLIIDRDAAARLGVGIDDISNTFNDAFSQRQVSTIYGPRNQYRVVLEIDPALQQDATQFDRIFVPSADGTPVPLKALARVERDVAPVRVTHRGQYPATTISFNISPDLAIGDVAPLLQQAELEVGLPDTIRGQYGGNAAAAQSFMSDMPILILAALAVIYIVLGVLYESFIHPITILSTLPTAGIGALLALMVTNTPLSVIALIGVILLMGIVKKNAIMMVDFALEHERSQGSGSEESILAACRDRFRPILMTTLAAIFGAVPLAVASGAGSELHRPLGITIIGGLLLSQLLTLYTTPVVYLALDRWRRRPARRPESHAPATPPA
ncbi:efflux RND transporter permease subunit [Roseomonas marmotae]|uniref:Efflux RND transporter permease subunit n=1 Tax=Roseomonas marmotae TaxID=2768161 RepID=A0ABS3KHQ8_9PROT|nr:efflux RND transporter permease subunit [Roseomonas marmotae]MBO1076532.1 efflux RND transporter permease subunit [Roseomonas marmotae]QTI81851.1 efflux RND transporter permease subunit [Roseomonas marmotae]